MSLETPGTCGICQTDCTTLDNVIDHFQQAHLYAGVDWPAFEAAWTGRAADTFTVSGSTLQRRLGISLTTPMSNTAEHYAMTGIMSIDEATAWVRRELGETSSKLLDLGEWMVQYLMWHCRTTGSNKLEGTGSFTVTYLGSPDKTTMSWETFFQHWSTHAAATKGSSATPRDLWAILDPAMQDVYFSNVPAVVKFRATGTQRSNRFHKADGTPIEVWWSVPGMFPNLRAQIPRNIVDLMNSYSNLDTPGGDAWSSAIDQSGLHQSAYLGVTLRDAAAARAVNSTGSVQQPLIPNPNP